MYYHNFSHHHKGFRSVSLGTHNDTDPGVDNGSTTNQIEGSGIHGMYFRINGVVVWCRGANVVPMDQLEGKTGAAGYRRLVRAAAKANMNMLRVWGGGTVLPTAFYEACDEFGIMLYHDLLFVEEQNHGALLTDTIQNEIRHHIRSLIGHPSIVMWSGCNECNVVMGTPTEMYATFVMQTVVEEDNTRPIWPSCPSSSGWKSGVTTSSGIPNGNPLVTKHPATNVMLERHGPYQHGYSTTFPAVDTCPVDATGIYLTKTPPVFASSPTGPSFRNTFVSVNFVDAFHLSMVSLMSFILNLVLVPMLVSRLVEPFLLLLQSCTSDQHIYMCVCVCTCACCQF